MRWYLLRPLAATLGWIISVLNLLIAVLGCLHFFLITGGSLSYVLKRRQWFESSMLGRPMGFREFLEFGSWHAELRRKKGRTL